jgi:S1-C subfamily serine protease
MVKKNLLVKTIILLLTVPFLFSCLTPNVSSCQGSCQDSQKEPVLFPLQSFVKLVSLMDGKPISTGSGAVIKKTEDYSFILTAAHVCQNLESVFVALLTEKTLEMVALDLDGKEHSTKVFAVDHKNDICLLKSDTLNKPALVLSNTPPVLGEKYYNMAAPLGWSDAWAVPMFEGYYSGQISIQDQKYDLFTIPVQGGSSGSPIFNDRREVVGMIIAKAVRMENLALGPTYESIKSLLDEAFENEEDGV